MCEGERHNEGREGKHFQRFNILAQVGNYSSGCVVYFLLHIALVLIFPSWTILNWADTQKGIMQYTLVIFLR